RHGKRPREASRFDAAASDRPRLDAATEFLGYESLTAKGRVVALFDADGAPATSLGAEQSGTVVLDRTPFYAESGGQVGDTGTLSRDGLRFDVSDTIKLGSAFGHVGRVVTGRLEVGAQAPAAVDG